ncbi:Lysyl oxidase 3 [Blyttiomyces sp. JEL0837]|nr:Lysyl oxidase 3 [Blyttiomyces sp. JEL0837]
MQITNTHLVFNAAIISILTRPVVSQLGVVAPYPGININTNVQAPLLADFEPDQAYLASTMSMDFVDADADPCLVREGCLSGPGLRRVLRFGTKIHNIGTADAVLAYAHYDLLKADGSQTGTNGTKAGFCLEDFECPVGIQKRYDCANQGVTAGCADLYDESLKCQWIDVTDYVKSPQFSYTEPHILRVVVNKNGFFPELSLDNNAAMVNFAFKDIPERVARMGGLMQDFD